MEFAETDQRSLEFLLGFKKKFLGVSMPTKFSFGLRLTFFFFLVKRLTLLSEYDIAFSVVIPFYLFIIMSGNDVTFYYMIFSKIKMRIFFWPRNKNENYIWSP